MQNNTSIFVYQPTPNWVEHVLDPNAELSHEIPASVQGFWEAPINTFQPHAPQDPYPSNNCFYGTHPRLVLDPSASPISIGAIPDNNRIQSVTTPWSASTTGHFVFRESPAPNEFVGSHLNEMYKNGYVTEHYPPFMTQTMLQIESLATETSRSQSGVSPLISPISPEGLDDSLGNTSESPSQADSQSASQKCHTLWKQVPVDAIIVTGSSKFVPQKLYKPFTEADKERYLERVLLSPPIIFMTKEPFEWGISFENVRKGKTQNLVDKDDPVLQDCGPSVTIRINWPGYSSFRRQISSRNWRKTKGPITKEKLAQCIAKTAGQFIEKMSSRPLEFGAEKGWKVGKQHIKVEDLILVSLHHVSQGSWQPHFRLRRDIV